MKRTLTGVFLVVALLAVLLTLGLYERSRSVRIGKPHDGTSIPRDTQGEDRTAPSSSGKNGGNATPSVVRQDVKRTGGIVVTVSSTEKSQLKSLEVLLVDDQTGKIDAHDDLEPDKGAVEFRGIPVGTKKVVVLPQSGGVSPAYASTSIVEGVVTELTVTLAPSAGVAGIVVDEMGNPVAGVNVTAALEVGYALPEDEDRRFHLVSSTSTDGSGWTFFSTGNVLYRIQTAADGRFRFPSVGWGPVKLSAKKGDLKSIEQWANPGDEVKLVIMRQ